ncbi:hypothetical protein Pelo_6507 [Pelomyxa schiedti]|nr:hypothetical protein Pelo_6507 [Pelomyxa schiedti]
MAELLRMTVISPETTDCMYCGETCPTKLFCGCQLTFYCGRGCQINDWPVHKEMCTSYGTITGPPPPCSTFTVR